MLADWPASSVKRKKSTSALAAPVPGFTPGEKRPTLASRSMPEASPRLVASRSSALARLPFDGCRSPPTSTPSRCTPAPTTTDALYSPVPPSSELTRSRQRPAAPVVTSGIISARPAALVLALATSLPSGSINTSCTAGSVSDDWPSWALTTAVKLTLSPRPISNSSTSVLPDIIALTALAKTNEPSGSRATSAGMT